MAVQDVYNTTHKFCRQIVHIIS